MRVHQKIHVNYVDLQREGEKIYLATHKLLAWDCYLQSTVFIQLEKVKKKSLFYTVIEKVIM